MIQNNLDPDVAENPQHLVVYGGIGRAARDWACFDRILEVLKELGDDESLLIQSGKPVGVFKTHADAPRVLLANSNLVPQWATWEHFNELDRKGLFMYGQMTAGSWIYIGSQGIVQGTYETFAEAGRQHYGGSGRARWILTAGLGGMGGAQPLAATLAGAVSLTIECQQASLDFRLRTRYLDKKAADLDDALALVRQHCERKEAVSIGVLGNAADDAARAGEAREGRRHEARPRHRPDVRARSRSTAICRSAGRSAHGRRRSATMRSIASLTSAAAQVLCRARAARCSTSTRWASRPSTTATTSARSRSTRAWRTRSIFRASCRPTSGRCSAKARDRSAGWRCQATRRISTRPTRRSSSCSRENTHVHRWLDMARERIAFQGLPARICWLGLGERHRAGLAFNEMVKYGELKAPIVIGRDHLDTGSVASPNRETESMQDGTDAVSDWPLLNALLNTAGGATWVSLHHGGGVGMGYSQHAGVVIVADGTDAAAKRLARVLFNDSGVRRDAPCRRGLRGGHSHRARAGPAPADGQVKHRDPAWRMTPTASLPPTPCCPPDGPAMCCCNGTARDD